MRKFHVDKVKANLTQTAGNLIGLVKTPRVALKGVPAKLLKSTTKDVVVRKAIALGDRRR